jgi:glutamine synthetase
MFRSQILPAALRYQQELASSINSYVAVMGNKGISGQKALLTDFNLLIETGLKLCSEMEVLRQQAEEITDLGKRGITFCDKVLPKSEELRLIVDSLESSVDDALWPLPKYRELLFMV